jgi:6-phosphofructokinase 1
MLVVSEGLDVGDIGAVKDSFGHTSFSASQISVAQIITNYLNSKGLAAKGAARCNVSGTDQRNSIGYASEVDLDEAYEVGVKALELADKGESGFMSTILRKPGPKYGVTYDKVPLPEVANSERTFPEKWILPSGIDVSDEFLAYCQPLVGDTMVQLPMEDGRQRLARIKPIFAEQKLAKYVPQADRMKAPGK